MSRNLTVKPPEHERTLWLMVAVQFFMAASFTVLSPIMPLFLPQLGVHGAAQTAVWSGLLNAATPFVAAFASPLWGRVGDRRGRKLMLLRSMVAVSFFTALSGCSQNVWQFLALRALMGAFSGFSASAITLVAVSTPEVRLGYALGWMSTGQLAGGLMGPLLGGLVAELTGSYQMPFFVTSFVAAVMTVLAALFIHDQKRPEAETRKRRPILEDLESLLNSKTLLPVFVVLLLSQLAVRTVQPIITLYVQSMTPDLANTAALAGFAFSITGIADIIASPFLGKRSDTLGYRRVMLISLVGATMFTVPQAFTHNYWLFVFERFGVGLFIGGILPAANALIGRLVAPERRGSVYSLTSSATFFGNSIGPLTGGIVAAALGLPWVFLVTAVLLFSSLVWTWRAVPTSIDDRAA